MTWYPCKVYVSALIDVHKGIIQPTKLGYRASLMVLLQLPGRVDVVPSNVTLLAVCLLLFLLMLSH